MLDAYQEKEQSGPDGKARLNRVLALHPSIAPVKVAVILCDTEKVEVRDVAQQLASELRTAGVFKCDMHTTIMYLSIYLT